MPRDPHRFKLFIIGMIALPLWYVKQGLRWIRRRLRAK
jgi:hypothetical protein